MPVDVTPGVTGSLLREKTDVDAIVRFVVDNHATGDEYGFVLSLYNEARLTQWGVQLVREPAEESAAASNESDDVPPFAALARSLARQQSAVPVTAPAVPALSGNLVDDVRAVTGLTYSHLADGFGISERAVAGWRAIGAPRHRTAELEALRSIGLILIGGLGSERVARWLLLGRPSRLHRALSGQQAQVAAEARAYEYSPAT